MASKKTTKQPPQADYFFAKEGKVLHRVCYNDIRYVKGCGDYCNIYTTKHEKCITVHQTMQSMEEQLQPYNLLRVHKSYIVNLHFVKCIDHLLLTLDNAPPIHIGRTHKEELLQRVAIL